MAFVSRYRERLYFAGFDMRQRGGESRKHCLRLAAKNIGERRTDAAIRHVHDIQSRGDFELLHREMRQRSRTR